MEPLDVPVALYYDEKRNKYLEQKVLDVYPLCLTEFFPLIVLIYCDYPYRTW